jgi:hypothetical protein
VNRGFSALTVLSVVNHCQDVSRRALKEKNMLALVMTGVGAVVDTGAPSE